MKLIQKLYDNKPFRIGSSLCQIALGAFLGYEVMTKDVSITKQGVVIEDTMSHAPPVPSREYPGCWEMYVDEYYEKATPRDDIMPGMRVVPFEKYDAYGRGVIIKSNKDIPLAFEYGEFADDYFGQKYGSELREIFKLNGIDIGKLAEFLRQRRNERRVSLYDDGFMVLGDSSERMGYILRINPEISKQTYRLYFPPK